MSNCHRTSKNMSHRYEFCRGENAHIYNSHLSYINRYIRRKHNAQTMLPSVYTVSIFRPKTPFPQSLTVSTLDVIMLSRLPCLQ